jgi:hypothetical protein
VGYSFDTFVAAMKCFNCNLISPADESTNMQTYLRDNPQLENLSIGSYVGDSFNEMRDKHYLILRETQDEQVILLDTWNCPFCGQANWASIKIVRGTIADIQSVEINQNVLSHANFVSIEISGIAMDLSGKDYKSVNRDGILETLIQYLK